MLLIDIADVSVLSSNRLQQMLLWTKVSEIRFSAFICGRILTTSIRHVRREHVTCEYNRRKRVKVAVGLGVGRLKSRLRRVCMMKSRQLLFLSVCLPAARFMSLAKSNCCSCSKQECMARHRMHHR